MSKALAVGFLLLSVAFSTANAQVLNIRCDLRPDGVQLNVYRQDITINLANKTIRQHLFSTYKGLDGKTFTYRNRKADDNVIFDQDEYVLVLNDRVQWGNGSPNNSIPKIYYFQQKTLTDGGGKYQCTEG